MRASQVTACTLAAIAWGIHDSATATATPLTDSPTHPQSTSGTPAPVTTVAPPETPATVPESSPARSPVPVVPTEAVSIEAETNTTAPIRGNESHDESLEVSEPSESSDRPASNPPDRPVAVPVQPSEPHLVEADNPDPKPVVATPSVTQSAPSTRSNWRDRPAPITPMTALTRWHPGSALSLQSMPSTQSRSPLVWVSAEQHGLPATRNLCGRSPRTTEAATPTVSRSAGLRFSTQTVTGLDNLAKQIAHQGFEKTTALTVDPERTNAAVQVAAAARDRLPVRCPFPKFTTTKTLRFSSVRPAVAATPVSTTPAIAATSPFPLTTPLQDWRFPLPIAAPITSEFGWRIHPITGDRRFHEGIDFSAETGTPVFSARSGQIKTADWLGGYGLTVVVDHGDYQTLYAHLSDIVVEVGSRVETGTILGKVGNTGNSTGPHLHFEIRQRTDDGWLAIDPAAIAPNTTPTADITTVAAATTATPGLDAAILPTVTVAGTPSTPSSQRSPATVSSTIPVANAQQTLPTPPIIPAVRPDRIAQLPDSITTPVSRLTLSNLNAIEPSSLDTVEDWVAACRQLAEQGQYGRALATCDRAIALQPRQIGPWFARGQVLMQLGRYEDAIAAYDYVLTREPNQSLVLTERCNAYRGAGELQHALTDCDRALDINLNWGDRSPLLAHQTRGIILLQQNRYAEAIAAFDTVLADTPNHSLALTLRGRANLALGHLDAALADSDRALAVNQQWGAATPAVGMYHRALVLTEQQRYDDAIAAYETVMQREPNHAAVWANHGMLLLHDGRVSEALLSLQQATQLNPNASLAWLHQADALNQLGQHDPALAATEQALAGDRQWGTDGIAKLWTQQAAAHAGLTQPDRALEAANRAVTLAPNESESWVQQAIALWKLERLPEALSAANRATELNGNAHAWLTHGRLLHYTGQPTEAIASYTQAIKQAQSSRLVQDSLHHRSLAYQTIGQLDAALSDRDRLVSLEPRSTDAWYQRAGLLLAMDRYDEAIADYDQVLNLSPNHADAWAERGMALRFLGDEDGALVSFDRAEQNRAE